MLLDSWQRIAVLHFLYVGRDGEGSDRSKGKVAGLTPAEKAASRRGVGQVGIGVSELGGEELDEAPLSGGAVRPDGPGQALDPPASEDHQGRQGRGGVHRQRGRRRDLWALLFVLVWPRIGHEDCLLEPSNIISFMLL